MSSGPAGPCLRRIWFWYWRMTSAWLMKLHRVLKPDFNDLSPHLLKSLRPTRTLTTSRLPDRLQVTSWGPRHQPCDQSIVQARSVQTIGGAGALGGLGRCRGGALGVPAGSPLGPCRVRGESGGLPGGPGGVCGGPGWTLKHADSLKVPRVGGLSTPRMGGLRTPGIPRPAQAELVGLGSRFAA